MKLYTYFRSSAAYRVRIALNLKGIDCESAPVNLRPGAHRQPDYLARNPQGLIPALEDGGAVIGQSLAIIEYLEETHPQPPLLPRATLDRARVRSMALAVACDIHPLNNLRVLNYLRSPLGHDEAAVDTWYRHWIAEGFRSLEEEAERVSGDGRHMFGMEVTLADVCLVPQMANARRFKCNVEPFPVLRAICAHLETLSPFARAAPDAQPDAS
ncbi:MAG: maleylacetoacetate isomerase [Gammaproteobacteria bacterium]|nr:maleylacetoacetate isomerase [Gammaproteobacteria bacterium]MDE2264161.1 maleylacetoacetate isomerase [Gammaproteobacteria bacterium]